MAVFQALLNCHAALSPVPPTMRQELQERVDVELSKIVAPVEIETLGDLQAQQAVVESLAKSIKAIIEEGA
jgi:hypothetical protein